MNLFGHLVVAGRLSAGREGAAFLAGAVLPDLHAMVGRPPPAARGGRLGAGLELHHATDALFHRHPTFHRWLRAAREPLQDWPKGARRAATHVAVEMLLDGALLALRRTDRVFWRDGLGYLAARGPEHGGAVAEAAARLLASPLPEAYAEPSRVATRTAGRLAARPRLVVPEERLAALHRVLEGLEPKIARGAEGLLADILGPLAADSEPEPSS